ncbi:uncharacterized protein LOC127701840 [Mytilus californianus]|uniref:uncharacterized protein LOC127701840 n=1 Tax=Mytilus californianus TaxID=6549 RepID=UPI0022463C16|nr:uncharacterized protein LOC127701840 [Mytilus californianus]
MFVRVIVRIVRFIYKILWIVLLLIALLNFGIVIKHLYKPQQTETTMEGSTWFLVLCTTLVPSERRNIVHNNTMHNWRTLGSDILPVLFLSDEFKNVRETFIRNGWKVFAIEHSSSDGTPILRHFFSVIHRKYQSKYIGYANADILFTSDLRSSLNLIDKQRQAIPNENVIFISGCRFDIENITSKDISSYDKILQIKEDSKKHPPSGQDYFITDFNYPWGGIPDVVVGKHKIDNWLLINAIENSHTAIDASVGITAVHQTVDLGSWESGKMNSNSSDHLYNENLLQSAFGPIYFASGNLNCLPLYMTHTYGKKEIVLIERTLYPEYCMRQQVFRDFIEKERKNAEKQRKERERREQSMFTMSKIKTTRSSVPIKHIYIKPKNNEENNEPVEQRLLTPNPNYKCRLCFLELTQLRDIIQNVCKQN